MGPITREVVRAIEQEPLTRIWVAISDTGEPIEELEVFTDEKALYAFVNTHFEAFVQGAYKSWGDNLPADHGIPTLTGDFDTDYEAVREYTRAGESDFSLIVYEVGFASFNPKAEV